MSDIKVQFGLYLFIMAKTHKIIQLTNRSENKPLASIWLKCMHAFILVFSGSHFVLCREGHGVESLGEHLKIYCDTPLFQYSVITCVCYINSLKTHSMET